MAEFFDVVGKKRQKSVNYGIKQTLVAANKNLPF